MVADGAADAVAAVGEALLPGRSKRIWKRKLLRCANSRMKTSSDSDSTMMMTSAAAADIIPADPLANSGDSVAAAAAVAEAESKAKVKLMAKAHGGVRDSPGLIKKLRALRPEFPSIQPTIRQSAAANASAFIPDAKKDAPVNLPIGLANLPPFPNCAPADSEDPEHFAPMLRFLYFPDQFRNSGIY